ncbi:hypothetical protein [Nocardia pseudovaccinii]|uniref:hypothetical protein n=1 Tax=Nocardia pseudovaccinii TaxID=189540 RepID=UPI0007A4E8B0|nr:hypothetical protein [Nocardia pseudovaccinii]
MVSSLVALWSSQEEACAEVLTKHGEYPSEAESEESVRTHRRLVNATSDMARRAIQASRGPRI